MHTMPMPHVISFITTVPIAQYEIVDADYLATLRFPQPTPCALVYDAFELGFDCRTPLRRDIAFDNAYDAMITRELHYRQAGTRRTNARAPPPITLAQYQLVSRIEVKIGR